MSRESKAWCGARDNEKQILRPAYPTSDWSRSWGPKRAGSQDDTAFERCTSGTAEAARCYKAARAVICWLALTAVVLVVGCGHKQRVAKVPATAPPIGQPSAGGSSSTTGASAARIPVTELPDGGISAGDKDFILSHRPIYSETGSATWYTAPYKGRKAANGEVFRDDALTAAHRTLPMGSLIVVTNLKTRQSSAMRISDRGPFVPNKNLDLTIASAKAIGMYRMGTAPVQIDVYETPKPMDMGGRWCVQIGAYKTEKKAERMKLALLRAYPDANVIEFPGEASYWVRIRPHGDQRALAEQIMRRVRPTEGDAYLTRLD